MSISSSTPRVVVVGGGVFGVSSAFHLARLGAHVTLVTEGEIGDGASGRSLSWLNSSRTRAPAYFRLRMAGIDRYRTLSSRFPNAPWLRFDGGLAWAADDSSNFVADTIAFQHSVGYDARLLAAGEVAEVVPGVDPRAVTPQGAIFNPGEGWVDLPSLIAVLLADYTALGGRCVVRAGPATVVVRNGRATGVTTASDRDFEADAVLVATGAAVPAMVAEAGMCIPDMTPISLLVKVKPFEHPLRAVLNTPRVAIRRTPDGAFALDHSWAEKEIITREDGTYDVRGSTVQGLLDAASAVLSGNPKLELERYGVGPKPIPADGEPVFGELDPIRGYFVAFSHSGATLGLIAGELLASEIVRGEPHPLLEAFRHRRFSERAAR